METLVNIDKVLWGILFKDLFVWYMIFMSVLLFGYLVNIWVNTVKEECKLEPALQNAKAIFVTLLIFLFLGIMINIVIYYVRAVTVDFSFIHKEIEMEVYKTISHGL